ncbi:hypothetical protein [Bradyrhizobium sp. CB3481]|uniref:hypothetical protein n=1 Tax=Bradyrhizobium sp. CB3481 TaxID=3039158 RepID=UPI0024B22A92|nr:hypothetical protein [Bradyrhizobium sp. CB3481]WFU15918.1 hypothetical protein QA643_33975 [Bradyrhizobium sp. CB3481]
MASLEAVSPVRQFVRTALVILLALMALPAALFVTAWLWFWYQTAEVDSFYREHRLLGEMRAAEKQSTNNSEPARDVLLKAMPLGTDRAAAIALLRKEKLDCQGAGPVNCQALTANVLGSKQWIIDLEFDGEERLSNARVAIWNVFL